MWTQRYYDFISRVYDPFTAVAYGRARKRAVQELMLEHGAAVLDLACGTGQNFPLLVEAVGHQGRIVGLDYSAGMLRRAAAKIERGGWSNVTLVREDARKVSPPLLQKGGGVGAVDGLICTLGLSVVPDWEQVFDGALSVLNDGGRCVVMDGQPLDGPLRVLNPIVAAQLRLIAAAQIRRPILRLLRGRLENLGVSQFLLGLVFVASGVKR